MTTVSWPTNLWQPSGKSQGVTDNVREKLYPVFAEAAANTHLTEAQYRAMYDASIADPESFWAEQARSTLTWSTSFSRLLNLAGGTDQVVRRRFVERDGQLYRPTPSGPRRSSGDYLGRGRTY